MIPTVKYLFKSKSKRSFWINNFLRTYIKNMKLKFDHEIDNKKRFLKVLYFKFKM